MRTASLPPPRPENRGLAFAGAVVPRGVIVNAATARRWLAAANPTGRPNAEVLRPYVDADDFRGGPRDRWVIDFPAGWDLREPALYAAPWRRARRAGWRPARTADPLRQAVARLEHVLAAPAGRAFRGWAELPSPTLPGRGLVVAATDDPALAAVLQSGWFAAWVDAHGGRLRVAHLAAFPLPWPPGTPRGSLSRSQEEQWSELRRAALAGSGDELDAVVARAYGWPGINPIDGVAALRSRSTGRRQ